MSILDKLQNSLAIPPDRSGFTLPPPGHIIFHGSNCLAHLFLYKEMSGLPH